ncbi:MAG TPA: 2-dehydro-3-deoxygalactonokinase, partial [Mesorhizobium sp.]
LGFEEKRQGAPRLSGLLIGSEIAAARSLYGAAGEIVLLASGALGNLYQSALVEAGYNVVLANAEEAVRIGLAKAAARLWGKE